MTTETLAETSTQNVPAVDAVSLKRFFKSHYGVPVRVNTGSSKRGGQLRPPQEQWIHVWIPSRKADLSKGEDSRRLYYSHQFPIELGNLCMRTVYSGSSLSEQYWGGNISARGIAMSGAQWQTVLRTLQEVQK